MHEKHDRENAESASEPNYNRWILAGLGIIFVLSVVQTFQLSSTLSALNARTVGANFSATATPLSSTASSSGTLDTTGWTANEKMNYEMHGIIPARSQGTAKAPSTAGSNGITQGLPSQVGGC